MSNRSCRREGIQWTATTWMAIHCPLLLLRRNNSSVDTSFSWPFLLTSTYMQPFDCNFHFNCVFINDTPFFFLGGIGIGDKKLWFALGYSWKMSENSRSLFFLLCFIVLVLAPERMRGCVNVIAVLLFFCSANSVFYFVYCMQKKKTEKYKGSFCYRKMELKRLYVCKDLCAWRFGWHWWC